MDYVSITPVAKEVSGAMAKYSAKNFANPSALYGEGMKAKEVMKESREKIARVLGTRANEIIFTSGGTESDNLALLGVFEEIQRSGLWCPISQGQTSGAKFIPHIVTTRIEHPAILEVCKEIERRGGEVTYVGVSEDGLVSPKDILAAIKENTVLVSVMYANNEIGTIQPIKEIGKAIKNWKIEKLKNSLKIKNCKLKIDEKFPIFHVDACQAGLYCPLDVAKLGVDLMTLDGIKMHGPRGVGILYVRTGVKIKSIMFGGGQQGGLRSGTENVEGMVGMAKALELAENLRQSESARLQKIRDYGIEKICQAFPNAKLNGSQTDRLPNNINICFSAMADMPAPDSEYIVVALDVEGIATSYSSSCQTSKENSSSYVISELGRKNCSASSLRVTLGRTTTKKDIDVLVKALKKIVM